MKRTRRRYVIHPSTFILAISGCVHLWQALLSYQPSPRPDSLEPWVGKAFTTRNHITGTYRIAPEANIGICKNAAIGVFRANEGATTVVQRCAGIGERAGEGIRTLDVSLGKAAFYH